MGSVSVYDPKGAVAQDTYIDLAQVAVYKLNLTIDDSMMPQIKSEVESAPRQPREPGERHEDGGGPGRDHRGRNERLQGHLQLQPERRAGYRYDVLLVASFKPGAAE